MREPSISAYRRKINNRNKRDLEERMRKNPEKFVRVKIGAGESKRKGK